MENLYKFKKYGRLKGDYHHSFVKIIVKLNYFGKFIKNRNR